MKRLALSALLFALTAQPVTSSPAPLCITWRTLTPMMTLGEIRHDRPLEVVSLCSQCGTTGRLAALGFLPGRKVRVSRVAPLGDPISVELEGQEISVRRSDAGLVSVKEVS